MAVGGVMEAAIRLYGEVGGFVLVFSPITVAGILAAIANENRRAWAFFWPWLWGFLFLGFAGVMGDGLRHIAKPLDSMFVYSELLLILIAILRTFREPVVCFLLTVSTCIAVLATAMMAGMQMSGDWL